MIGTFINVLTILIGSLLGLLIGAHLSDKLRETIMTCLGLFTLGFGLLTFIETENALVPFAGLLIGALLGEWWQLEELLQKAGGLLRRLINGKETEGEQQNRFVEGFMTATLVYVIGPIAILGAIQDGLTGNYELLTVKAIIDGFASIAFASSLGIGVAFSILPILIYQGSISLLAGLFSQFFTSAMITEMTAVGGLILIAISISSLLRIKKIRVGSFLPALVVTPLIVYVLERFFKGL